MNNKKRSRKYGIGVWLVIGFFILISGQGDSVGLVIIGILVAILWTIFQTREGAEQTDSYGNPI